MIDIVAGVAIRRRSCSSAVFGRVIRTLAVTTHGIIILRCVVGSGSSNIRTG